MTGADWIALLLRHAKELREVGVLSIRIDGAAATFAPPLPAPSEATAAAPDDPDPLNNPALYPDGRVPGYTLEPDPNG
jgi:hypothetical protein